MSARRSPHGVIRLELAGEGRAAVVTRGELRKPDWDLFRLLCGQFPGLALNPLTKEREIARSEATSFAAYLKRRGFQVVLAPELEGCAVGARPVSFEDVVALARPIFFGIDPRPLESRTLLEAHFLDLLVMPIEGLRAIQRGVLVKVMEVARAVRQVASSRFPELADQARALESKISNVLSELPARPRTEDTAVGPGAASKRDPSAPLPGAAPQARTA